MTRFPLLALATSLALVGLVAVGASAAPASAPAPAAAPTAGAGTNASTKLLRYAFPAAETGFDPAQVTDLYSNTVLANIFEAPLEYEFLARPVRIRTNTAAALPEVSADFTHFVFRIQPGIYFADDPAFKGQRRELTAADYVYAIKRHYDPRWKSGKLYVLEEFKLLGMDALRKKAVDGKTPFDYDSEAPGLRTLDRYRFELRLAEPSPRLLHSFVDPSFVGAVAREVVDFYGDKISEHPVGTGPFKLAEWRRSSKIALVKNPGYREVLYDEHPAAGDTRREAIARQFQGRRLPMIDRVEVSIVEEPQPRWLTFLNEEQDLAERVPEEFARVAFPGNKLAPNLAKRGIQMIRYRRADVSVSYFAMENPVVGGYTPEKVALRRAIAMAQDVPREIDLVRRGQAVVAQSVVPPETWGYDPAFRSEMGEFDRAKANALLDLYGYKDRDGDGWREQPDGSPLEIEYATQADAMYRALYEQWHINTKAIGIRSRPLIQQWPENLKSSRAGRLMMWGLGYSANAPDAENLLAMGYGPNKGQANHARFDLPAFNALYRRQSQLPDGPERLALINEAKRLMIAYMPYKVHTHRIWTDLTQPWVKGHDRNLFVRDFWKYLDVDPAERARRSRR